MKRPSQMFVLMLVTITIISVISVTAVAANAYVFVKAIDSLSTDRNSPTDLSRLNDSLNADAETEENLDDDYVDDESCEDLVDDGSLDLNEGYDTSTDDGYSEEDSEESGEWNDWSGGGDWSEEESDAFSGEEMDGSENSESPASAATTSATLPVENVKVSVADHSRKEKPVEEESHSNEADRDYEDYSMDSADAPESNAASGVSDCLSTNPAESNDHTDQMVAPGANDGSNVDLSEKAAVPDDNLSNPSSDMQSDTDDSASSGNSTVTAALVDDTELSAEKVDSEKIMQLLSDSIMHENGYFSSNKDSFSLKVSDDNEQSVIILNTKKLNAYKSFSFTLSRSDDSTENIDVEIYTNDGATPIYSYHLNPSASVPVETDIGGISVIRICVCSGNNEGCIVFSEFSLSQD